MIEEILKRLAQAREHAGLSQSQANKLLKFAVPNALKQMEAGEVVITLQDLLAMCELYQVNIVWVMTGRNPDFDPSPLLQWAEARNIPKEDVDALLTTFEMITQEDT